MAGDGHVKKTIKRALVDTGVFVDGDFWAIAIYEGPSPLELAPAGDARRPVLGARDVTDLDAMFVADPFMLPSDHGWDMFFEVMNRDTGRGEIALASSTDGRRWTYRERVIAEPFHLSYPYVFAWEGEHYLVPETLSQHCVYLYRAVEYPTRWEMDDVLLAGTPANDASLFRHDDRWWMFVETSDDGLFDTLRLYHADDLHGAWTEHPDSPIVKGDATAARPAGRVVRHEGGLLRFAQDCSEIYGRHVTAYEVRELTTSTYREAPVGDGPVLRPAARGWNELGMHQLDAHRVAPARWVACVDGRPDVGLRRPPLVPRAQRCGLRHSRARSSVTPRRT